MKYKKSKETQAEVIDAAISMIYSEGIENISLNKILKKGNVSKGSFYHQFKDLDDLLKKVFMTIATYFFKDFSLSPDQMTKEKIKSIGKNLIFSDKDQDKMSSVFFILLSRSFSSEKLKSDLINFRKKVLNETEEKIDEEFVMLYDILIIGFLAQSQVVESPDKLLDLWNQLVDKLLF